MAISNALIDFLRPTNNGKIISGKITTSRNGNAGKLAFTVSFILRSS